jgi:hypothetical protein
VANGTQVRRVLLQIETDDGDTEEKLDRISARADELAEKHPELKVKIDSAAAAAKLSVLRAELKDVGKDIAPKVDPKIDDAALAVARVDLKAIADEKIEPKVKPVVDKTAAMTDAKKAGADSGGSFGGGFGAQGYLIAAGVAAALAARRHEPGQGPAVRAVPVNDQHSYVGAARRRAAPGQAAR